MEDTYKEVFSDLDRVLVVMAHPENMEINCGGLVARLISDKKTVRSVIMTDGQKGVHDMDIDSGEFAIKRIESQLRAGDELDLNTGNNINLKIRDGEVENNQDTIGMVVGEIRKFRPQIVITHKPVEIINHYSDSKRWINHRDHRNTASVVFDAVYPYSIDHGFYPEQIEQGLEGWKVSKILTSDSYMDNNMMAFDITEQIEKKKEALMKHTDCNVLSVSDVEDLIEECREGERYFEKLGFIEI